MVIFPSGMLGRLARPWAMALLPCLALGTSPAGAVTTCSVTSPSLVFGTVNVLTGAAVDTTGTITVSCTENLVAVDVDYVISLSAGSGGNYAPRKMAAGSYTLDYNVYQDAARSLVLGDGSGSTVTQTGGFLLLLGTRTADHTIYGRINDNQQTAHTGTYGDSLTITLTY